MAPSLTHAFNCAVPDDPADVLAGMVVPTNWNDEHSLTLATGMLIGRTTAGTGAAEEVPIANFATAAQGALADAAQPALALAANQFYARSSAGAAANKTISDDALTFNAAANFAAMRTALGVPGLGDANTWTAQNTFAAGSIATSQPLTVTQTWNAGAVPFKGIFANITDTASAAASLLMDLQVGSSTKFSVDKTGIVKALEIQAASGNGILRFGSNAFTDRVGISAAVGVITMNIGQATLTDEGAADVFALRRSTNAQKVRAYRTYTDASNYERQAFQSGAGYFEWAAETAGTGTDNIDLKLTPAGTGVVQYGTHSGIADETVTGYITIKDAGGTTRKLAVVS